MMTDTQQDPPSPCIGICQINPTNSYCEGCFRDLDEIAGWWEMAAVAKRRLISELDSRRERILSSYWDQ